MVRVLPSATSTRPHHVSSEGFEPSVVVGADGSPWGSAALGWAARYAWLRGEALTGRLERGAGARVLGRRL